MSRTVALSVRGLKVHYGPVQALKGINLDVYEGSVVALLGANGAGKTTTLQTISGLVHASEGSIKFYDQDITNKEAEKITGLGIVQSPEGRQIFLRPHRGRKSTGGRLHSERPQGNAKLLRARVPPFSAAEGAVEANGGHPFRR